MLFYMHAYTCPVLCIRVNGCFSTCTPIRVQRYVSVSMGAFLHARLYVSNGMCPCQWMLFYMHAYMCLIICIRAHGCFSTCMPIRVQRYVSVSMDAFLQACLYVSNNMYPCPWMLFYMHAYMCLIICIRVHGCFSTSMPIRVQWYVSVSMGAFLHACLYVSSAMHPFPWMLFYMHAYTCPTVCIRVHGCFSTCMPICV
jgi:hypothetical protein